MIALRRVSWLHMRYSNAVARSALDKDASQISGTTRRFPATDMEATILKLSKQSDRQPLLNYVAEHSEEEVYIEYEFHRGDEY